MGPESQGDGIVELPGNVVVIFDVSLGIYPETRFYDEVDGVKNVTITETLIAQTFENYLRKNCPDDPSAREVVELGVKFLNDKVIKHDGIDLGLSVTACKSEGDLPRITLVSFGSNIVFGPDGRILIRPEKSFDPEAPKETKTITNKLHLQTTQSVESGPILMATDGFSPRLSLLSRRFSIAREGYPLEKLTNPDFFRGEALVVRIEK